jgi:hypothetical protein
MWLADYDAARFLQQASECREQAAKATLVRYYVAKCTAPAAEAWARSKGATGAEIDAARRCVKEPPTQTAR